MDIATKSGPELVALYNNIPGVSPVKKFSSRSEGVKRITRALAAAPSAVIPETETKVDETKPKRGPKAEYGTYNRPRGQFITAHRENSGRGRLIEDLKKGCTFTGLLASHTQWTATQLHKTILMLNWYLGYGLTTDEQGIITLTD